MSSVHFLEIQPKFQNISQIILQTLQDLIYERFLQQSLSEMEVNNIIVLAIVILVALAFFYRFKAAKPGKQKLSVQLVEAKKLTHDTIIFTFVLPNTHKKLGLKVGEHIEIEQNIKGEIVKRKYTPISPVDKVGSFQLLLKIYRPTEQFPNGGKMSSFLADLPLNSKINIILPFGRFNYLGNSVAKITDFQGHSLSKKYKNFYMVAGGTGITPIFQIIQYCCDKEGEDQRPYLHLLFANRTQSDILMKQILDRYAQKTYKIKVYYSVDQKTTQDWNGFVGFVDESKIKQTVPEQIKQTIFMTCGPPPLCNNCQKIWKSMGVTNEQIYRF